MRKCGVHVYSDLVTLTIRPIMKHLPIIALVDRLQRNSHVVIHIQVNVCCLM